MLIQRGGGGGVGHLRTSTYSKGGIYFKLGANSCIYGILYAQT